MTFEQSQCRQMSTSMSTSNSPKGSHHTSSIFPATENGKHNEQIRIMGGNIISFTCIFNSDFREWRTVCVCVCGSTRSQAMGTQTVLYATRGKMKFRGP